jgi:dihydroneopterin triphosphate diphosphatase
MTSTLPSPSNLKPQKIPVSVMVVVYTQQLQVLLLERADVAGFWQSVTGSVEAQDLHQPMGLRLTAARELFEETGIQVDPPALDDWRVENRFLIYPQFRHRYPAGTTHNTEHVFALQVPEPLAVTLAPREHLQYAWLPWQDAAQKVRSWSNRDAIERLVAYAPDANRTHV